MGVYLASIPKGMKLYHGTLRPDHVQGLQWMAFDPQYSVRFGQHLEKHSGEKQQKRELQQPLLVGDHTYGGDYSSDAEPGYLHTYVAAKDLRLLYFDGMSGMHRMKGTRDMQDRILFNESIGRVPSAPDNTQVDFERAILGCQLADTEWEGRVDGFLRTQEVQEIIPCHFERDLELTQVLRTKPQDDGVRSSKGKEKNGNAKPPRKSKYNSRYDDLAVGEVTIDFDHFVTAYEYGLDLFPGASKLPCLSHIPTEELEPIRRDVKNMILTREPSRHAFDWKAITDKIISQYSSVLQDIAGGKFSTMHGLRLSIEELLAPFIDYGDYYNITSTVERCREEFIPISAPSNTLTSKAVRHVTSQICSALTSALLDFDLHLEDVVNNVQGLILYLEWTAFAHRRN